VTPTVAVTGFTGRIEGIIRLTSLAPDLVEAILDGQEPDGFSLWALRRDVPLAWNEQPPRFGLDRPITGRGQPLLAGELPEPLADAGGIDAEALGRFTMRIALFVDQLWRRRS